MSCGRCGSPNTPCTTLGYCEECLLAYDREVRAHWKKQEREHLKRLVTKGPNPSKKETA